MTREKFLEDAWTAAKQSSAQSGMPAAVTVAQAALESNWGQSQLSREANNYFGIKAHGKHAQVQMTTKEFKRNGEIELQTPFAKYESLLDCFRCRDGILARSPVYAEARQQRENEMGFIAALAKHWATDPEYAEKLQAMLKEVKERT